MEYPLHKACKDGDVQTVNMIMNSNKYLSVMEEPFKNWSPIHWAAYCGHLDCLRQVISFEPTTINLQSSKTFQTPLHCAAEGGHPHCVLWLLQAGVNPDVKDNIGETALHKASKVGSAECVGILISTTLNISVQNSNGQTASMLADISGYPHIASFIRQREVAGLNVFHSRSDRMGSFPICPRLSRKRTRDMCDLDSPYKRQRSYDMIDIPLPPSVLSNTNSISTSVMEHEDLCGSEIQYTNVLFESMIQEWHGC